MTYKEFGEEADIEYKLIVCVNNKLATVLKGYDLASLANQSHKINSVIEKELQKQYEDLPEPIEDESRGFAQ